MPGYPADVCQSFDCQLDVPRDICAKLECERWWESEILDAPAFSYRLVFGRENIVRTGSKGSMHWSADILGTQFTEAVDLEGFENQRVECARRQSKADEKGGVEVLDDVEEEFRGKATKLS
jgi:hypothetical protein